MSNKTPAGNRCKSKRNAKIVAAAVACLYCDNKLTPSNPGTIDHMVPRALGGRNAWWNLAVACLPCNYRKRDLPFEMWIDTLLVSHQKRALRFYEAQSKAASPRLPSLYPG